MDLGMLDVFKVICDSHLVDDEEALHIEPEGPH